MSSSRPFHKLQLFLLQSITLSGRNFDLLHFVLFDAVQRGQIRKYFSRFLLVRTQLRCQTVRIQN